jgi:membrane protein YqaA with SNARE-associated domain
VDSAAFLTQYGLYAGSALYCFLGGLIPVFNIEAYLLVLASTTNASRHWVLLTLVATGAHMAAKSLLYASGRGIGSGIPKKHQARIEQVRQRLERWRYGRTGFVFISALTGFPPFYAVSVLAGALKFGYVRFYLAGTAGRFLRFAAFLLFPQACLRLLNAL